MSIAQSTDIVEFRRLLQPRPDGKPNKIIAVCGAGLSAASGIPTFRGAGGLWHKYNAMSLATRSFYHYRRETARAAQPNPAHMALAAFSIPALREALAPNSEFAIITQNVDGLSRRALEMTLTTSVEDTAPLLEMHGRIFDVQCTDEDGCGHVEYDTSTLPLGDGSAVIDADGVNSGTTDLESLPRCRKCSALARPGVVWFGEMPKHLEEIDEFVEEADLCLVVGTSSTVYPAAGYASVVQEQGGKVAVFNLDRSEGDEDADFLFLGPCEETLPKALGQV